jgi:hypothetical protein
MTELLIRSSLDPVMSDGKRITYEDGVLGSGRPIIRIAPSARPEGGGRRALRVPGSWTFPVMAVTSGHGRRQGPSVATTANQN